MQAYNWILSKITLLWTKLSVTSPLGMSYQNLIMGLILISILSTFVFTLVKGISTGRLGIKSKKGSDKITTTIETETIYYFRSGKHDRRK